jgi:hypothetical protein
MTTRKTKRCGWFTDPKDLVKEIQAMMFRRNACAFCGKLFVLCSYEGTCPDGFSGFYLRASLIRKVPRFALTARRIRADVQTPVARYGPASGRLLVISTRFIAPTRSRTVLGSKEKSSLQMMTRTRMCLLDQPYRHTRFTMN